MKKAKKIIASVPVSSMADIAFLLLIFFMVTSVLKVDADLPLELPDAKASELKEKDLAINIDKFQRIYFGNVPVTERELVSRLQAELQYNPEKRVIIQAHNELPYEVLDKIFQYLKEIGANNIAIVTKQNERKL